MKIRTIIFGATGHIGQVDIGPVDQWARLWAEGPPVFNLMYK